MEPLTEKTKPSTELVMHVLGDEDGFKLAEMLIRRGPQAQTALANSANVDPKRAAEQLRVMRALGLVERERPARGKWSVTNAAAIATVFASAARLAATIGANQVQVNEEDREGWEQLAEPAIEE
jgi:predicted transcriptional regulator